MPAPFTGTYPEGVLYSKLEHAAGFVAEQSSVVHSGRMERRKRALAAALAAAGVGLCVVLLLAAALPHRRQVLLDAGAAAQGEAPIPVPAWAPAGRETPVGHQAEWWPEGQMPWEGPLLLAASMGSWLGVGNGERVLPPETRTVGLQALKDFGVPWASPVGPPQGYAGAGSCATI